MLLPFSNKAGSRGSTGPTGVGTTGPTGAQGATGPTGSGGGGAFSRSATKIVAASNSLDTTNADYVCTGTNDHTTINTAIAALPSGGGRILLMEGTYTLGGQIIISNSNITLEGQGAGTVIKLANAINNHMVACGHATTTFTNVQIKNIFFDGNRANQSSAGVIIDNGFYVFAKGISNLIIQNCYLYRAYDCAVADFQALNNTLIKDNIIIDCQANNDLIVLDTGGNVINNYINPAFLSGLETIKNATNVIGNVIVLPSGSDWYCLEVCQNVFGNKINIPSAASTFVGIQSCNTVGYNTIIGDSNANISSIGIVLNPNNQVVGNNITNVGIGISGNSKVTISSNYIAPQGNAMNITSNSSIVGNIIDNLYTKTTNTYSGISMSSINNIVQGNIINNNNANKFQYGITENGSANKNIILGNQVTASGTTNILSIGANTDVSHNITT